jgi:hypothetical protein
MKKTITVIIFSILIVSCNNKKPTEPEDKRVSLRSDTLNVVKLTDTLVIFESTCRGCEMESSTNFEIKDSLGIVKLNNIITTDNNPSGMSGGNISKDLILVPQKTGSTTVKLYKFWGPETASADSTRFTAYTIEVRN